MKNVSTQINVQTHWLIIMEIFQRVRGQIRYPTTRLDFWQVSDTVCWQVHWQVCSQERNNMKKESK